MKKWNIGNLWKKYKYVGLVVLAGILLMLLPGKKTAADPQESGGSFSLEDTERRMEELLGRMDGVGRVQVMLTLKNGPELELAEDADDTDRDGELRRQREQLQQLLEAGWRAAAEALLAAYGKPDPADIPGAEELRRGLTVRQLRGLTELMKRYCLECRYNVGVGHVLGALCAGWQELL